MVVPLDAHDRVPHLQRPGVHHVLDGDPAGEGAVGVRAGGEVAPEVVLLGRLELAGNKCAVFFIFLWEKSNVRRE